MIMRVKLQLSNTSALQVISVMVTNWQFSLPPCSPSKYKGGGSEVILIFWVSVVETLVMSEAEGTSKLWSTMQVAAILTITPCWPSLQLKTLSHLDEKTVIRPLNVHQVWFCETLSIQRSDIFSYLYFKQIPGNCLFLFTQIKYRRPFPAANDIPLIIADNR